MTHYSLPACLVAVLTLSGCVAGRPPNTTDLCEIFADRRSWYKAAVETERKWGSPVPVNMAVIYQESGFRARARPARRRFLWIIPGGRPSSAFGYAQALESTWEDYIRQSGNRAARRDNFADAVDFVGWYNAMSTRVNGIAPHDAANLYYAYHEGNGGYATGRHRDKPWLLDTGRRVQENAWRFDAQFASCESELARNWFQRLFS